MPLTPEERKQRERELNEILPKVEGYKFIYNFFEPTTKIEQPKEVDVLHYGSLKTALHYAAELGDLNRIKNLLKDGAQINIKAGRKQSNTALLLALLNDNDDVAAYLIEQGADVNINNNEGVTPLHIAMARGKFNLVKQLINKGADFQKYDVTYYYTPLAAGIVSNQSSCVNYALPFIADLAQKDLLGKSLLHLAIEKNQIDIALALILHPSANQMISSRDIYGRTPFDLAMAEGMDEVISKLSGLPKSEFSKNVKYKVKFTIINQEVLIEKFKQYLDITKKNSDYLNMTGMCNGLAFISGCFAVEGKINEFYDILTKIAQCDFQKMSLQDPELVKDLPRDYKNETYKNMDDLFNKFLNDITWHHHHSCLEKETGISKAERQKQFEISSNRKMLEEFAIAFKATQAHLTKILEYLVNKSGRMILFSGGGHSVQAFVLSNHQFFYYDPTLDYRPSDFTEPEKLGDFIQKIKYGYLNKHVNGEYEADFYENMELYIAMYQITDEKTAFTFTGINEDEEFLSNLLVKTNAFYHDGKLDAKLMESSLIIACYSHNPQSVRALLKYGKYEESYMQEAFNRSIVARSISCLLAILEEGYKINENTPEMVDFKFKCYVDEPSEVDKFRFKKIQNILAYYYKHPIGSNNHDPVYSQLIAAIEKNSPEHLSTLLEQYEIKQQDLHNLVRSAVFLEKKSCLSLLLNKVNFLIEPDLIELAKNTFDLDLIKSALNQKSNLNFK